MSSSRLRLAAIALSGAIAVGACGSGSKHAAGSRHAGPTSSTVPGLPGLTGGPSSTGPSSTASPPPGGPGPLPNGPSSGTGSGPTGQKSPQYPASSEPALPHSRSAPDQSDPPLRYSGTFVAPDATGRFAGRTQATNTSGAYLNGVTVTWRILDKSGHVLDHGSVSVGAIGPGETTAVPFTGSARYTDSWSSIEFAHTST